MDEINATIEPMQEITAEIGEVATLSAEMDSVPTGGGTRDYNNLENKPAINGVELVGDLSLADIGAADDTEVVDIRIGADGTTYPTAGEAVRGQVTGLKQDLETVSDYNLRGLTKFKPKWEIGAITNEGTEQELTNFVRTGYYLLKKGDYFKVSDASNFRVFYYETNGDFIETLYSVDTNKAYDYGRTVLVRFRQTYHSSQKVDWFNKYITIVKTSVEATYDSSALGDEYIDEINRKVAQAIDGNCVVFCHMTDSHVGRDIMPPNRGKMHMSKMLRIAEAVNADFCIHTGDAIQGNGSATGTNDLDRYNGITSAINGSAVPLLWCQGNCNHDFGVVTGGKYNLSRKQTLTFMGRNDKHIVKAINANDKVYSKIELDWEVGAITNEGAEQDSTSHSRSKAVYLSKGDSFRWNGTVGDLRVFYYNTNGVFTRTMYTSDIVQGKYYIANEPCLIRFRSYYNATQTAYKEPNWMNAYLEVFKGSAVASYYHADLANRCRLIVLDADDRGGNRDSWGWSDNQIAWFGETLTEALNHDMPVIIYSHMPPSADLMPNCPESSANISEKIKQFTSNGGRVLAFVYGHVHWDAYYLDSDNDIPYISCTCTLPEATTESFVPTVGTKEVPQRRIGDITEYAIDTYVVNVDTGHASVFRYGAGHDRTIR